MFFAVYRRMESRRLEFCVVWNSAPFGIPRRLGFRAVWPHAFAFRAPSLFSPARSP